MKCHGAAVHHFWPSHCQVPKFRWQWVWILFVAKSRTMIAAGHWKWTNGVWKWRNLLDSPPIYGGQWWLSSGFWRYSIIFKQALIELTWDWLTFLRKTTINITYLIITLATAIIWVSMVFVHFLDDAICKTLGSQMLTKYGVGMGRHCHWMQIWGCDVQAESFGEWDLWQRLGVAMDNSAECRKSIGAV